MTRQDRSEEYAVGRPREDTGARGLFFDCGYCIRTSDDRYTGPTVAEGGNKLEPWEVLERYNQRRYAHLERDYADAKALREHLVDRAHYWVREGEAGALASALAGIDATVTMMEQRRARRSVETKGEA